ncbi:FAD-dependent oxidoreductase [Mesorhizobium sp. CC13]|uniref:FAD-dependent oxidoreductase n=1 Tax=Mesorhizobium sp. CC13 TaxID=3029194 RepID=UPI0032656F84
MTDQALSRPFWFPSEPNAKNYPQLNGDRHVDAAVVGAGIVGLTTAHLLAAAGLKVAVVEARQVGRQATGRSTAKVTSQHGMRYAKLIREIGETSARRYAGANESAVDQIRTLVADNDIDCGMEDRSACVFGWDKNDRRNLVEEADAASRLGLPASFVEETGLPFPTAGAVIFAHQAQFDPFRYLLGLAEVVSHEAELFEHTRATEIDLTEPARVKTERGTIAAASVVLATQLPTVAEGRFYIKAYPVAHPLVAARLPVEHRLDRMYISNSSPIRSLRTARQSDETYLIAVGDGYRPGSTVDEIRAMQELHEFIRRHFAIEQTSHSWTNEDFVPMDGLPFIGPICAGIGNIHVATGFGAWGITQATVAAQLLADRILGRSNDLAGLFDPSDRSVIRSAPTFISENLRTGVRLVSDKLFKARIENLADIPDDEGGIIEFDGELIAVLKQGSEVASAFSASCTHLGCVLGWNPVDRSWDCPCHGSRFDTEGQVIAGPAVSPLRPHRLRKAAQKLTQAS